MLYFVATPIGNLKDITYRAVEVLKSVDEIACEDTRHTLKLLNAYEIKKPLFALHKFNEKTAGEFLIKKLEEGKNIALVSDAGMPLISDPGNILVKMLVESNQPFTVIPGPTAFVCGLIMSGLLDYRFTFVGFLPEKKSDRKEVLERYKNYQDPTVFYLAPHDVEDTVKSIYKVFGNRKACAVREITKTFETREEFYLEDGYAGEKRGEFVLIVGGAPKCEKTFEMPVNEHIALFIAQGMSKKEAIKAVAKERGVHKNEIYKYTLEEDN